MKCFGCHVAHHKQNLWDPKQSNNKKDVLCSALSSKNEVISALEGRIPRSNLRPFAQEYRDMLLFGKVQFKPPEQSHLCRRSQCE